MNKQELARQLARKAHRSRGQAADAVDNLVFEILKDLKTAQRKPAAKSQSRPSSVPASASRRQP